MAMLGTNRFVSGSFRVAVAAHFVCLYVLTFGMRRTLLGPVHYFAAAMLNLLMAIIVVLFTADMLTTKAESRRSPRIVDGALGLVWITIVGLLLSNNLRTGIWR
jgi:hypothetical protein